MFPTCVLGQIQIKMRNVCTPTRGNSNGSWIVDAFGDKGYENVKNVYYVKGLKHNLLSISQLYDKGYEVKFEPNVCLIKKALIGEILFSSKREKPL